MHDSLVSPGLLLFAQTTGVTGSTTPTWTDKEVLVAIGSTIGTLLTVGMPVFWFLLRRSIASAKSKTKKLENDNHTLRENVLQLKQQLHDQATGALSGKRDLDQMKDQVDHAQQEIAQLMQSRKDTEKQADTQHQVIEHLKKSLDELQGNLAEHQSDLKTERRRIDRALQKDGQTWTEKVRTTDRDRGKPLQVGDEGRQTPIISVLNLKGGVGKTTITANLGAALDTLGYRVLLLDLDLQGSLTSLFLSESTQAQLFKDERLIGDFLAASFDADFPNLLDYMQPVLPRGNSGLVATTDQLAYAEMNLTIRWLLREGNRDPRFLLRRELHLKRITNHYDIVLLDCPPLINISCVNALAASDYVLVPILPSKQATARVPILLQRLKDFRDNINAELKVLGILANRTHRAELTLEESNRLTALRDQCRDIWGHDVPMFDTYIRQNAEIRAAEDEHRPLHKEGAMYDTFVELAREVEGRLPTFCRPPSESPAPVQEVVS